VLSTNHEVKSNRPENKEKDLDRSINTWEIITFKFMTYLS